MKLPVLMYHNITENGRPDDITITVSRLEQQLQYIKKKGYQTISLRQFYHHLLKNELLPEKPLLISFDDGFKSNFKLLYPLLSRYHIKAAVFLVANYIRLNENLPTDTYLHIDDIRHMDAAVVDYGFHSFNHENYNDLSIEEIDKDLQKMQDGFKNMDIDVIPVFAYPFGAFPKNDNSKMERLKQLFLRYHIVGAFRIGNRINSIPITATFNIQRIDVKGTDSFWKFKAMLRLGKKWLI